MHLDFFFPGGLPENYHLRKIPWQLIGHLTFDNPRPDWKRRSMFSVIMRKLAKRQGVYYPKLLWVLKQEWGEEADIPHYHFLTASLPPEAQCESTCRQIRDDWTSVGGGHSLIEPYNPKLSGRDYVLKCTREKSGVARSYAGDLEDTGGLTRSEAVQAYLKRHS